MQWKCTLVDLKRNTTPFKAEKYDRRGKATKCLMKNQSQCIFYNP
jgi:hypothetical protein